MKPKVYLETTVISYLTARPSRDIVVAAHQELTRQWWDQRRKDYHLVVSEVVLREAAAGDPDAADRRSTILAGIDVLEAGEAALELAEELVRRRAVPDAAAEDALHIAIAVTNGIDYLLTWNCAHIANAAMRRAIDDVCVEQGYEPTVLCTPEELIEE
ncbi:MAG: type II toxin-antitoxin system VapC family toxin [Candidatus Binatia bacterium]